MRTDNFFITLGDEIFFWRFLVPPLESMEPESQWKFETRTNGDTFTIKTVRYNEYLYSPADNCICDSHRCRVFTWKDGSYGGPVAEWEITPQSRSFTLKIVEK